MADPRAAFRKELQQLKTMLLAAKEEIKAVELERDEVRFVTTRFMLSFLRFESFRRCVHCLGVRFKSWGAALEVCKSSYAWFQPREEVCI